MSVTPLIVFADTGATAPKEPDILAGILADYNSAFGGNLNTTNLESPQGQLASSETVILGELNDVLLSLINQVNPDFASGFMQDALAKIYFIERKPAQPTVVQCDVTGLKGTTINAGYKAVDTSGNIYQCTTSGVIDNTGTISLPFANMVTGAIPCPANTLTSIYQFISGWTSINNPSDGALGHPVESRADFAARRNASVFLGGNGSTTSSFSAISALQGVLDVYAQENNTGSPITVGSSSYVIPANTVYFAVEGGIGNEIANAIYSKSIIAALSGNTTINVVDPITGVTYPITYNIPDPYLIKFVVNVKASPINPANAVQLIRSAIVAQFNGTNGGNRERIGNTVFASSYYSPTATISPNMHIVSILVGHSTANALSADVGIDQSPVTSLTDITVNFI